MKLEFRSTKKTLFTLIPIFVLCLTYISTNSLGWMAFMLAMTLYTLAGVWYLCLVFNELGQSKVVHRKPWTQKPESKFQSEINKFVSSSSDVLVEEVAQLMAESKGRTLTNDEECRLYEHVAAGLKKGFSF